MSTGKPEHRLRFNSRDVEATTAIDLSKSPGVVEGTEALSELIVFERQTKKALAKLTNAFVFPGTGIANYPSAQLKLSREHLL
jgi:hypothetical protein